MIQAHSLAVQRTAHYYTLGQPGPHVRKFWLVCHGYGQPASSFIHSFKSIQQADAFIVAPEGLSRFYWGGFTGQVVSSWMTSKDRLEEIADYTRYLRQLYDLYTAHIHPEAEINMLGFSQGCATQMRWLMREHPRFDRLFLWSGQVPEDIDYSPHLDYLSDKQLHFAYGNEDKFITKERVEMHQQLIEDQQLQITTHEFEGGHSLDIPLLRKLAGVAAV
ncbi:MAG: phospholipase [Bacteroidota bacterium]